MLTPNRRTFSGISLRSLSSENATRVVLICWAAILLIFAALPVSSIGRMLMAAGVSWAAEAFAAVALIVALLHSTGRLFWALFGGAVFIRYAGDLVWTGSEGFGLDLLPTYQAAADAVSYPLFFGALLWLAKRSRQEMTPVAVLDTVGVMLSSGLLLWYFILGPEISPTDLDGWEDFVDLAQPVCDLGLFLLALGILRIRSPFVTFLTGGLLLLLLTDGSYLELRTGGTYVLGGWPVLFWSGGVALLGIAALQRGSIESLVKAEEPRSGNLETFLFWLGPLSPPLQYGALLIWGALHPPLPGYVLLCGTALLVVFAIRTYAANHVGGLLTDKREASTREIEQRRISEDLHDTLKPNVHCIPLMLGAYREARERGELDIAEETLDRVIEICQEASYRISYPIGELWARRGDPTLDPVIHISQLLQDIKNGFTVEVHEDMRACPSELTPEELAVTYRIVGEALWNAAKHAEAKNLWVESRKEDSAFLVEIRDDGRGFSTGSPSAGLGLSLMRSRAEQVGADLRVTSAPGSGTTVRLRFDKA